MGYTFGIVFFFLLAEKGCGIELGWGWLGDPYREFLYCRGFFTAWGFVGVSEGGGSGVKGGGARLRNEFAWFGHRGCTLVL